MLVKYIDDEEDFFFILKKSEDTLTTGDNCLESDMIKRDHGCEPDFIFESDVRVLLPKEFI